MPLRWLAIAFALAIASFFGSTLYAQYTARAIDAASQSIATNAMPSIQRISSARAEMRRLWIQLHEFRTPDDSVDAPTIEATRSIVDGEVAVYVSLPTYPGERELSSTLQADLKQVDESVDALLAVRGRGNLAPTHPARMRALDAVDAAIANMRNIIQLNAENGAIQATEIERARARTNRIAIGLDVLSAVLTLIAAGLAVRTLRHYERVREEHNRLVASRAEELEQFAGRVAHDVLGPLAATSLAIQTARRKVADDKLRDSLERGARGVDRVQTIVDGLLRFARAGARPEPGVSTAIRPVVEELAASLGPCAEENHVELVVEGVPDARVACNAGVLTSVLENLVRNAIKYMLGVNLRRVTVRADASEERVHIEVRDTGPGIPPSLLPRLFEPYVRGADTGKPGIGLGLATVRRVVEAHGGTVGVQSTSAGSLFWFELPRAAAVVEETEPAPSLH
jgi:signal transduction histidine kinase